MSKQHPVIRPTLVLPSVDGSAELSVWPPIPGGNKTPVVQIDVAGDNTSVAVEYTKEQAVRLATAILAAAYLPEGK
jgi:hypothetical protein